MRLLWNLVKVVVALVLVIPVTIIVLATALGVFGALVGLAILALKLALIGLVGYGVFRLIVGIMGGPSARPQMRELSDAARPDPYYQAAMRELDQELGTR